MSDEKREVGYMCGVDWQHELGHAMGGNVVYPSVEDLKANRKCVRSCGIVKVEVKLVEWVQDQDFSKISEDDYVDPQKTD